MSCLYSRLYKEIEINDLQVGDIILKINWCFMHFDDELFISEIHEINHDGIIQYLPNFDPIIQTDEEMRSYDEIYLIKRKGD